MHVLRAQNSRDSGNKSMKNVFPATLQDEKPSRLNELSCCHVNTAKS